MGIERIGPVTRRTGRPILAEGILRRNMTAALAHDVAFRIFDRIASLRGAIRVAEDMAPDVGDERIDGGMGATGKAQEPFGQPFAAPVPRLLFSHPANAGDVAVQIVLQIFQILIAQFGGRAQQRLFEIGQDLVFIIRLVEKRFIHNAVNDAVFQHVFSRGLQNIEG